MHYLHLEMLSTEVQDSLEGFEFRQMFLLHVGMNVDVRRIAVAEVSIACKVPRCVIAHRIERVCAFDSKPSHCRDSLEVHSTT